MNQRLKDKTALITGAGQGIGRLTALAFASQGARVWATGRTMGKLEELVRRPGIEVAQLDVTDAAAVNRVAERTGPVDVLVNCAGRVAYDSVSDCRHDSFARSMAVNVHGPFYMIQAYIDGMCERRQGSIINIASVYSSITSVPNRFAYTTSKAALVGMTKSVAADYADKGIRCNAVCPGAIDTPGLQSRIAASDDPGGLWQTMVAHHPVGRIGRADEVAQACVYLASDDSAFMTGQTLVIDGGMTL